MKIGIISDIHAEADALKLALDHLHKKGVDQIVCAGDLVEKGPDGDRVVELIQEYNVITIRGNHDQVAVVNSEWDRKNLAPYKPIEPLLKEETITYLSTLPKSLQFNCEGKEIYMAHGAPWSNMMYIYKFTPPSVFDRVVKEAQADIVILGHTHMPMQVKHQDTWIVNPGSVCYQHSRGSGTFGVLKLPEYGFYLYDVIRGEGVAFPLREW